MLKDLDLETSETQSTGFRTSKQASHFKQKLKGSQAAFNCIFGLR